MGRFNRARIWITLAVAAAVLVLPAVLGFASVVWGD